MVLSESPYLSNFDLLNSSIVPNYYAAPQCSQYVSLANLSLENFGKNNEIVNSYLQFKGLYEIIFPKNQLPFIFQF